jgi:hypothetical protein
MNILNIALLYTIGLSSSPFAISSPSCQDDGYSMYVWTRGFDSTAPQCVGIYPPNKDGDNASCFNHNWETTEAREKLFASCSIPGREITRLFVEDVRSRIENGGYNADGVCDGDLMALLSEAHERGISIYALFSVSNADFSESYMAVYPNEFNELCGTDKIYFDGVAVNNEYFSQIRACSADDINDVYIAEQQDHLDRLALAKQNAHPLPLHFSISWNWDCCSCSSSSYATRELLWPAVGGSSMSVVQHMVNIVDSVDVQVAYIKNSTMTTRSTKPYEYWEDKVNKSPSSKVYTLAYTNPTDLCQTSFSPHIKGSSTAEDSCSIGNERTEAGMFQGFDYVESQLTHIKGGIHFMNGVFASGITEGWPVHSPNPNPQACAPSTSSPSRSTSSSPTKKPSLSPITSSPATKSPTRSPVTVSPVAPSVDCRDPSITQQKCDDAPLCRWNRRKQQCKFRGAKMIRVFGL